MAAEEERRGESGLGFGLGEAALCALLYTRAAPLYSKNIQSTSLTTKLNWLACAFREELGEHIT
jgi:hypothetical protein